MTKARMIESESEALKVKKGREQFSDCVKFVDRTLRLNMVIRSNANGILPPRSEIKELRDSIMLVCALKYRIPVNAIASIFNVSQEVAKYSIALAELNLKGTEDFDIIYR